VYKLTAFAVSRVDPPPTATIASNFELLAKLIGKTIKVEAPRDSDFGDPRTFQGQVVFDLKSDTFVLRDVNQNSFHFLETKEPISYFVIDKPEGPIEFREGSIHGRINPESQAKELTLKISYSAKDSFEWEAEYWGTLDNKESELELNGWFNVKNKSGKKFWKLFCFFCC